MHCVKQWEGGLPQPPVGFTIGELGKKKDFDIIPRNGAAVRNTQLTQLSSFHFTPLYLPNGALNSLNSSLHHPPLLHTTFHACRRRHWHLLKLATTSSGPPERPE